MKHAIDQEIKEQKKRGVLLVLTGPTGAGKDALFEKLLDTDSSVIKITTTTSRSKRVSETEGNPYYFIPRQEFEQRIAQGAFFEWVEFRGELYGTQKKTLTDALSTGQDVIWHIEAKGVKNIKAKVKEMVARSVFIFLTADSVKTLEKRVHKDEGEKGFNSRWNPSLVTWEMEQYDDCDYLVVNHDGKLEETLKTVRAIMEAKRTEIIAAPEGQNNS